MTINYFDLGLFDGKEISMFLAEMKELGIEDYNVYGFEAHPEYASRIAETFKDNPRVHIHNFAISDKSGENVRLYIEKTGHGNSIYPTKNNIDIDKFVETETICFSDWIDKNFEYKAFDSAYNILRFNIEGAEIPLMNRLIEEGYHDSFDLYLTSAVIGEDILKVEELKPLHAQYLEMLESNLIYTYPYCYTLTNNTKIASHLEPLL
jgi:FkbM family methyltransferase